ncbi:MAG: hypothetical protein PHU28_08800, partial [Methanosarcinaceae archaeon]|nr:hypothetical protein [Methanosarcinaceae archaeon]
FFCRRKSNSFIELVLYNRIVENSQFPVKYAEKSPIYPDQNIQFKFLKIDFLRGFSTCLE